MQQWLVTNHCDLHDHQKGDSCPPKCKTPNRSFKVYDPFTRSESPDHSTPPNNQTLLVLLISSGGKYILSNPFLSSYEMLESLQQTSIQDRSFTCRS
ncbi:hypothetical protein GDO78_013090 [Eleutherodactylus coqui]|uniref:Uncharacterized protein n=1 Tax=Eleutherodactylus coqui TaxID=57060 RepID=A0A8J6F0D9_ELECQ|nr:hypothetical protein GDO78_013090 [Eleutherodactylus coqui]